MQVVTIHYKLETFLVGIHYIKILCIFGVVLSSGDDEHIFVVEWCQVMGS